jgi:pimeloyl-ACP methyl ester carboxylesterase
MRAHAADLVALLDHLGAERAVFTGHSLGAYIVARLAVEHPERVSRAVLVDGGLTIPGSTDGDPQAFIDAFLGPALARLGMRFETAEGYADWWRAHPAMADGQVDDPDLVVYANHDLAGEPPELRSAVSEAAVRGDAAETVEMGQPAHRLAIPATLMCAPRGLLNQPSPMQPVELVKDWVSEDPERRHMIEVPGVNHYTITLGPAGAAAVAAEISAAAAAAEASR